ncbi:MAG: hypothetical protein ACR2HF_00865 [Methylococcaceae bacterium]
MNRAMHNKAIQRIIILISWGIMAWPHGTWADWQPKASLQQQVGYEDNMRLDVRNGESVFTYRLIPALEAARKTGNSDLIFKADGDIRRNNDSRWDCDNFNIASDDAYRHGRAETGLAGSYTHSCAYLQQLLDIGIIRPRLDYRTLKLSPNWSWQWTPRDKLTTAATYSRTTYQNNASDPATRFTGNETWLFNIGERHQWNPRLSLDGELFLRDIHYDSQNIPNQTVYGVQLGGQYQVNRTLKFTLDAGPGMVYTHSGEAISAYSRWGYVVNIGGIYEGERQALSAGYSNAINPSALGQVLQYHTLYARYRYRLKPALMLEVETRYNRMESITRNVSSTAFERDYATASLGLDWNITRDLRIRLNYGYRFQEYAAFPGQAHSNSIILGLSYVFLGT